MNKKVVLRKTVKLTNVKVVVYKEIAKSLYSEMKCKLRKQKQPKGDGAKIKSYYRVMLKTRRQRN